MCEGKHMKRKKKTKLNKLEEAMSLEVVVLEHSYELKAEGMRVIHGFLGV